MVWEVKLSSQLQKYSVWSVQGDLFAKLCTLICLEEPVDWGPGVCTSGSFAFL